MIALGFRELWKEKHGKVYNEKTDLSCGVYVGHMSIGSTKANPKIGQCKHLTALARGRSQGGADWHFDYFFPTNTPEQAKEIEKDLHKTLKSDRIIGNQGQKEVYDLPITVAITSVKNHCEEYYSEFKNTENIYKEWSGDTWVGDMYKVIVKQLKDDKARGLIK
jgi:hypothetical protein